MEREGLIKKRFHQNTKSTVENLFVAIALQLLEIVTKLLKHKKNGCYVIISPRTAQDLRGQLSCYLTPELSATLIGWETSFSSSGTTSSPR